MKWKNYTNGILNVRGAVIERELDRDVIIPDPEEHVRFILDRHDLSSFDGAVTQANSRADVYLLNYNMDSISNGLETIPVQAL